jgi:Arc/MetJ-type ribon-helix-helix transcriptional regulator
MKTANLPALTQDELTGWFAGRLPDNLFLKPPTISSDRDEILIVGEIDEPEVPADASEAARAAARTARIARFRGETRDARIQVARDAERLFGRKVSWGARCGGVEELFTTLGVPVMTRLRLEDRGTLDTLIEAGVARSRSEALAWCVRLVAQHQSDWITSLREALTNVEKVRGAGPDVD